jgi:hypothetical protein
MLKSFFGSRTRVKLMGLFLLHPKSEFFIREITRCLREQINSVRRELDNLRKCGMLKTYWRNRKKFYCINPNFELLEEFKNIFLKTSNPQVEVVKTIREFGKIDFLLLAGQFIGNKKSDIDLLIVGELDKSRLKDYLEHELPGKQKIKFTVISRADFLYRLDCKDKFILDTLQIKDKVVPVNNLENYIEMRTKRLDFKR